MSIDPLSLPVARKVRKLSPYVIAKMNQAALGPSRSEFDIQLSEAIGRAEQQDSQAKAVAECVATAFRHAGVMPEAWPGALCVAYGAALATRNWRRLSPLDVRELLFRWDLITGENLWANAERLQLRHAADMVAAFFEVRGA